MTAEQLAQQFHETYERLAPAHGYETRKESAKPWGDVPAQNKALMIAVCAEILQSLTVAARATDERPRCQRCHHIASEPGRLYCAACIAECKLLQRPAESAS